MTDHDLLYYARQERDLLSARIDAALTGEDTP